MTSATSQSFIDESVSLPVARIDAQEIDYAEPLREYLETNGCQVFINKHPQQSVAYHIVCGDLQFVKGIFSTTPAEGVKQLGVVMGLSLSDAKNLSSSTRKIVVADPVQLTENDVIDIFSFFFGAADLVYDKRRNIHEPPSVADKPAPLAAGPEAILDIQSQVTGGESSVAGESDTSEVEAVLPDEDRQRIGLIISDVFGETPQKGKEVLTEKSHRRHRRKMKVRLWTILSGIFFMTLFPVAWYVGSLLVAGASYAYIGTRLKNGDVSGAAKIANIGNYWLTQSTFVFGAIGAPFKLFGLTHLVRGQERLLSFLGDVSHAYGETQKIVSSEGAVASLLLGTRQDEQNVQPAQEIHQLRLSVTSVQGSLGLAQAELATLMRDGTFPFFIPQVSRFGLRAEQILENLRGILTYVDQVLTLYPHLAGFKEPKTYLVLLQNSNELRPTGGFIGSVGIAKFEEGFLSDFTISDVYALDGQLKGHVDPPLPIRELLGQEHWYLRDSNWDPDFFVSAERAIWFYEKETGKSVDGVIAVNVPVVVDLMKATGPILLPDYNDRITADNFFGKSIFYTQANTFPGSTQKGDFLGSLMRTLMTKITTDKDVSPVTLFRAFAAGLGRRDIQFMFTDDSLQQLVDHFGWSGRIFKESGCEGVPPESCLFDPFAIAEANVSVSKINYFIKRTSTREIVIAPDGGVSENVTIRLRNTVNLTADQNARGLGGPYVTYMRFLVPKDSQVSDVTLDGSPVQSRSLKSKEPPKIPYIETSDSPPGSQGIGVAFAVAPGSERQVSLRYKRVTPLPFGRGGAYVDLLWYKHPGVSDNQAKTILRYPIYWVATDETQKFSRAGDSPELVAKDGQLEYNTTILQDQSIRLKFIK